MNILIIESNTDIAEKYKCPLVQSGFQIQLARSTIEALKIIDENNFNFILLNIRLPDMNGIDLIKELYKRNPEFQTRLIILTEINSDIFIQEAFNLNVQGFLIHSNHSPDQVAEYIKHAF